MKFYAGIGSRNTPTDVLRYMKAVAKRLASRGFILRSGAADGADSAFEQGCLESCGQHEIFIPWKQYNGRNYSVRKLTDLHEQIASELHPTWSRLSSGAKKLHTRNIAQVLGSDLQSPVQFVICWTPDGCESDASRAIKTGGTGTAISCASLRSIPVFNLANTDAKDRLAELVLKIS